MPVFFYHVLQNQKQNTKTNIYHYNNTITIITLLSGTKSESDSEVAAAIFLEVQNAYSILGSPIRRLQYDLSLSGVDYEDYEEPEPESMYVFCLQFYIPVVVVIFPIDCCIQALDLLL